MPTPTYDAVLHLDRATAPAAIEPVARDWEERRRTLPALEALLADPEPAPCSCGAFPFPGSSPRRETFELLEAEDGPGTVDDLRRQLAASTGVDLAILQDLADRFGYALDWVWSRLGTGRPLRSSCSGGSGAGRRPGCRGRWSGRSPGASTRTARRAPRWRARLVPEVRPLVKQTLPASMVPAVIEVLDALPLTGNGKVDYRALPPPRGLHLLAEETFVAPRTEAERTLAAIWAEVLRLDRVGIRDDVFELGGDSLMIFQITTRANQAGFDLTPRHLFQYRTIQDLTRGARTGEDAKSRACRGQFPSSRPRARPIA